MSAKVAIIGGGYGGTAVAKALEPVADVILIDPKDSFVNAAAALRALVQPGWAGNMFFPYDRVLTRATHIRDTAVSADPTGVTLSSGRRIDADFMILATGSSYAYPAKPGARSAAEAMENLRLTHKELAGADRVLILGAGPVGLELAGEIKEVWPHKTVTVVDPAEQLLPGFIPGLREDLRRQLDTLGVQLLLGTRLQAPPPVEPGRAGSFTMAGTSITADIWFQAYGVHLNSGYLADGRLTTLTARGEVPVTERLNVIGHEHVYAIGDLTDVAEAKMAAFAMSHAEIVARNITAQIRGEKPEAAYQAMPYPMILLPLGTGGGVGQMPGPDGPLVVPGASVAEYKGADLFTGRFTEQFGQPLG